MLSHQLKAGDEVRVIAPSRSLAIVKGEQCRLAEERLSELGFTVTYGKTVRDHDEFFSNSIEDRIEDLHDAFRDSKVKAIFTAIGGHNVNQILKYIDYELIKQNPKPLIGYSDITALQLAIYRKTGLITYSGPHFSTFGMKSGLEYTIDYFKKALMVCEDFTINPSDTWSDDAWFQDQDNRNFHDNEGYMILQEGSAEGTIIGGNLCTLNLLQGTEFMPSLKNSILFIEDDEETHPLAFDRDLQSLLHQPDANGIKAVVIGRFQKDSGMTDYALQEIIRSKQELNGIPIIANANIGHVHPFVTLPIGGKAAISVKKGTVNMTVFS